MSSPSAIWMWSPTWAVTVCWLAAFVTMTLPGGGVGDGGPPDPATLPHAATLAANATASRRAFMPARTTPASASSRSRWQSSRSAAARVHPRRHRLSRANSLGYAGRHRDPGAGREIGLLEFSGGVDHWLVAGAGRGEEPRRAREGSRTLGRNTRWHVGRASLHARGCKRSELLDSDVHRQHVADEPPRRARPAAVARSDRRDHRPARTRPRPRTARSSDRPRQARQAFGRSPHREGRPLSGVAGNRRQ